MHRGFRHTTQRLTFWLATVDHFQDYSDQQRQQDRQDHAADDVVWAHSPAPWVLYLR